MNKGLAEIVLKLCSRFAFFPPDSQRVFLRQVHPYYVETKQKTVLFSTSLKIPTAELFFLQYYNNHFAKFSIITKILSLEEAEGLNTIGSKIDYKSSRNQANSDVQSWSKRLYDVYTHIKNEGFNPQYPIEVDANMRIINGSHRFACACHLGIPYVPIRVVDEVCHADDMLFVYEEELLPNLTLLEKEAIEDVKRRLYNKLLYPFYVLIPSLYTEKVITIVNEQRDTELRKVKQICSDKIHDYLEGEKNGLLLEIGVPTPHYYIDSRTGKPHCEEMRFLRAICNRMGVNVYISDNYEACLLLKESLEL